MVKGCNQSWWRLGEPRPGQWHQSQQLQADEKQGKRGNHTTGQQFAGRGRSHKRQWLFLL